jgi:hypothetical protein
MSLINDALKQTKQSQPQYPPANPPSFRPVESAPSGGGTWLGPVVIILLLAAAGTFVGLYLSKHALPVAAASKVVSAVASLPKLHLTTPATNTVAAASSQRPEPRLQGILLATTRPCAIVNGKTVFVGDWVDGLRIIAISKSAVTLQNGTETNVLSLSKH